MHHTASTAELLAADRFQRLRQHQTTDAVSIENTEGKTPNNTSIELPTEIKELITGSDYWVRAKSNRYHMLIREGHLDKLLELAKLARGKDNPANWFAKACSKAAWDRTLAYFAKLTEVTRKADRIARRLGTKVNKFIYQQIWKGANVERWAAVAEETCHAKPGQGMLQHFAWLCAHERELAARS